MIFKKITIVLLSIVTLSCNTIKKDQSSKNTYSDITVVGAMKDVMWKGELESKINLDTVSNKKGLYGLGPESYLAGEILINNGITYVSKVTSDSTMIVAKDDNASAPFFVYANVNEWESITLESNIKSIQDLEKFIDERTLKNKRPFAFKLSGSVSNAIIHIQNLPKGTKVSSPKEAHQGQTNYNLKDEDVEIIGFFSTDHKGIFTHHDSLIHLHLITNDETKMGHLDDVVFKSMTLHLPFQ